MTPAGIDRLLAILVVAMAATGLMSLRFGFAGGAWLFVVHGVLAGALTIAVGLKLRTSVPRAVRARRWTRLGVALVLSVLVVGALVGGYAWVAGGEILSIGSWTVLTLHAWLGLAVVPIVAIHLLPRRWRLLRPAGGPPQTASARLPRRSLLLGGGLAAAGIGLFGVAQLADRFRGGERRFTGSRWLAAGGIPPATTFVGDTPPPVDPNAWRISVSGRVAHPLELDLAGLMAIGTVEISAVLDCTSGWAIDTAWSGTSLASLLDAAGVARDGRSVTIRSATGWGTKMPIAEARRCLLATGVAGGPLPVANGAPVRLVASDRRGLDWVKWVREVVVA